MNVSQRRFVFLRRTTVLCGVLVLAIISLSAFIRLSNAGLGCGDWPRCYGQVLREAQRDERASIVDSDAVAATAHIGDSPAVAAARLAHRVLAVATLLLVVAMVMSCFATMPTLPLQGRIALALLGTALFLAVLGRWTSGARVPAAAMGNLLGGFAMLALCARMAGSVPSPQRPRLGAWAWAGAALLLCQIALGGLVSAGYAGLSCPGLTGCDLSGTAGVWEALNPWREPRFDATLPVNPAGVLAHAVHRAGALVTFLVLLPLGVLAMRRGRRRAGAVLLALLAIQVTLGILMVVHALPFPLALAHNLVAALLLAVVIRLA